MTRAWQSGPAPTRAGVGLRGTHHGEWLDRRPRCGWLELHAENYFAIGGALPALLESLRSDYPLSIHGVGLGLGSPDPLDPHHLAAWRRLVDRLEPAIISEHLCWGALEGEHFNDLLPLPLTEASLARLVSRVSQWQDSVRRAVLIEHLASYVTFPDSSLAEAQFLVELARASGCGILLDLNNLVVNAHNHGGDPRAFVDALPAQLVGEIHLAGHTQIERHGRRWHIDDHGSRVGEEVWALYRHARSALGPIPTLIEWDNALPSLDELLAEAAKADAIIEASDNKDVRSHCAELSLTATTRPDSVSLDTESQATELLDVSLRAFATMLRTAAPPEDGGLAIYHHHRLANFSQALALAFPVLERLVGEAFFRQLAADHQRRQPSRSGDLHPCGASFATTLRERWADGEYAYLADIAALEWAWQRAFVADETEPTTAEDFAAIPSETWPALRFEFHPSLSLIESRWPIFTIWENHRDRSREPPVVRLDAGGENVRVAREQGRVTVRRCTESEFVWLRALQAGQTLDEAFVAASRIDPDFDLATALTDLLACVKPNLGSVRENTYFAAASI
ncbi:MAG: DUF692 family multinuclear iron-containing protein [Steroidobacteraceae bacterium]